MSASLSGAIHSIPRAIGRGTRIHHRLLSTQPVRHQGLVCVRPDLFKQSISLQPISRQVRYKSEAPTSKSPEEPVAHASKKYSFSEVSNFATTPSPGRILIDVREPSEIESTGNIPGAKNMPMNSAPDGLFLPAEEFEEKFGWSKPKSDAELVFYCKAGVRSRAAAGMARMAGWKNVSESPGSWDKWVKQGGKIDRGQC